MVFSFPWHLNANSWGQTQGEREVRSGSDSCVWNCPGPLARLRAFKEYETSLLEPTVNVVRFTLSVLYLSVDNQLL